MGHQTWSSWHNCLNVSCFTSLNTTCSQQVHWKFSSVLPGIWSHLIGWCQSLSLWIYDSWWWLKKLMQSLQAYGADFLLTDDNSESISSRKKCLYIEVRSSLSCSRWCQRINTTAITWMVPLQLTDLSHIWWHQFNKLHFTVKGMSGSPSPLEDFI